MIELGTIVVDKDRRKTINVYKAKECIGQISINVSDPEIETKLLNLIQIITTK